MEINKLASRRGCKMEGCECKAEYAVSTYRNQQIDLCKFHLKLLYVLLKTEVEGWI